MKYKLNKMQTFLGYFIFIVAIYLALTILFPNNWLISLYSHFYFHSFLIALIIFTMSFMTKNFIWSVAAMLLLFVNGIKILKFYPRYSTSPLTYKIYMHNINSHNASMEKIAHNALKLNPDFITLIETTPKQEKFFNENFKTYNYRINLSRIDNFGFSIYSRFPIELIKVGYIDFISTYVIFDISQIKTRFIVTHLIPPMQEKYFKYQQKSIRDLAREWRKDTENTIMMGDFNMTPWSSNFNLLFQEIKPNYYSSSLKHSGTWPSFLPFFLQIPIDHVFSKKSFYVKTLDNAGSDHAALEISL